MLPTPTWVAEDEGKLWCFLVWTRIAYFLQLSKSFLWGWATQFPLARWNISNLVHFFFSNEWLPPLHYWDTKTIMASPDPDLRGRKAKLLDLVCLLPMFSRSPRVRAILMGRWNSVLTFSGLRAHGQSSSFSQCSLPFSENRRK